MDIIERIYKIAELKGDSIYKLSKNLGVSNGYFAKQKQNKGAVSSTIIEKIVSYYTDMNTEWLITGKGGVLKDLNTLNDNKISILNKSSSGELILSISKVNKLVQAISQASFIGSQVFTLELDKHNDLVNDIKIFIKEVEKGLEDNMKKLRMNELTVKQIDILTLEKIEKCNYFIPILTEYLVDILDEIFNHHNYARK